MQFAQQRMDEFFALSPADQQKRLDEMIDRMLDRRKQREQNPPSGQNGQADRRGSGRQGWQNMTDAQRDTARKQRLDRTTPKMRAQFTEFRRMMNERMEQRGLSSDQLGGFRGGWGRGA